MTLAVIRCEKCGSSLRTDQVIHHVCPTFGGLPLIVTDDPMTQANGWYIAQGPKGTMNWWEEMYAKRIRLTQPYERDMVLWVADTADPAWVTYEAGAEFDCSEDEARPLIEKGLAVEVEK